MHLEEEDVPKEKNEAEAEAGDADDEDKHHGTTIVACDQSAITGESLAVDKYMVGTFNPMESTGNTNVGGVSRATSL